MAQYLVEGSDIESIADTIREKTGGTEPLVFPGEFKEAISGISGGATEPYVEETYDSSGNLIEAKLYGHNVVRNYMFQVCKYLTSISLPSGITSIGKEAFYGCAKLALTSLPSGITSIGNSAFYNCSNLALTSLPSGLTRISSNVFQNCSNLALTSLPSGITSIGAYSFGNCKGLTSITFESKPISITQTAFYGCTNITTINVPWAEGAVADAPWGATNATINYNYTGA